MAALGLAAMLLACGPSEEPLPRIFGTGSEDYFNYAWSSPDIFLFPYCGQPRNDGPGNRGFVTNNRWHIIDSGAVRRLGFPARAWKRQREDCARKWTRGAAAARRHTVEAFLRHVDGTLGLSWWARVAAHLDRSR